MNLKSATFTLTLLMTGILCAQSLDQIKVARRQRPEVKIPGFVGYVPDEIVVKLDKTTVRKMSVSPQALGKSGIPALDQVSARFGVVSIRQQFPGAQSKVYQGREIDLSGWHKVAFANEVDVQEAAAAYQKIPGVIEAQPIGVHTTCATPNDPSFSTQWHHEQANDHDIDAVESWDIETGNEDVIVAILDTGVRYYHKDLGGDEASSSNMNSIDGNVWVNTDEIAGNGVDDDGNGFVDDRLGWDFVTGINSMDCWSGEDCQNADNDPRDYNGHGTHVAGIVAALNNNGYAVASVAGGWGNGSQQASGNGVKVMALRIGYSGRLFFFYEAGMVRMDFAAEALRYAADNGARIVNASWSSSKSGGLADALDYFLASGGLFFKAAGNENVDSPDYLGTRTEVINVASTDRNDIKSELSNFGTWVDVSAPGTSIMSTYHDHGDAAADQVATMSGTSMATACASGVGALILSCDPNMAAAKVKEFLFANSENMDALNPAHAGKLGAGRVNVFNTINLCHANQPPTATIMLPRSGSVINSRQKVNFAGDANDQEDGVLPASNFTWWLISPTGHRTLVTRGVKSGATFVTRSGRFNLELEVNDSRGLKDTSRVTFTVAIPSAIQTMSRQADELALGAEGPTGNMLFDAYPNPFNAGTSIQFSLAEEQSVQLAIYNSAGQLCRKLIEGDRFSAGNHTVRWDGRSNEGGLAPSGIYFVRIDGGALHERRKISLVK